MDLVFLENYQPLKMGLKLADVKSWVCNGYSIEYEPYLKRHTNSLFIYFNFFFYMFFF